MLFFFVRQMFHHVRPLRMLVRAPAMALIDIFVQFVVSSVPHGHAINAQATVKESGRVTRRGCRWCCGTGLKGAVGAKDGLIASHLAKRQFL
ncbi:hypothetical protein BC940DRAFT_302105 [Gongronella butleri]|nr:hypothetical protein BC940DRAFT_302105 [Gongronella butleri]